MDYQFIHSVVQEEYVDLSAAKPVPPAYLKELRKYAGVCDCLDNEIGESYGFISIRTGTEIPVAFFSRTARKKAAVSVCKFVQSAGWEQRGDCLLEKMDTILTQTFYEESQLDDFAQKKATVPALDNNTPASLPHVTIAKEAIRAVLYGAMLRWLSGSAQVHIAVPESEMNHYNEYVLAAVREIYSYFPEKMREAVGFSSYLLPTHEKDYPKFSIIFIPNNMADARTIMLDGSSPNAYAAMIKSTGLKSLDKVLNYLAQLDEPEQRQKFLRGIFEDVENREDGNSVRSFSPMSYVTMGDGLTILEIQGSAEEQLPIWLDFAADKQRYPSSLISAIDEKISTMMPPQDFAALVEKRLCDATTLKKVEEEIKCVYQLCIGRETHKAALWTVLNETLTRLKVEPSAIFKAFEDNQALWSSLTDERNFRERKAYWGKVTADILKKQAKQKIQDYATNIKSISSFQKNCAVQRTQFEKFARHYIDSEQLGVFSYELELLERNLSAIYLKKKLVELVEKKNGEPKTQKNINDAISTIDSMAECVHTGDRTDEEILLCQELEEHRMKFEAQLNASQTIFNELVEEIEKTDDYFTAVDLAVEKANSLSEEDRGSIRSKLNEKRKEQRDLYFKNYYDHYKRPLTQAELLQRPLFGTYVLEDLSEIYSRVQPLELKDQNTASLLKQLYKMEAEAKWFGVDRPLIVEIGGYRAQASVVEQVLNVSKYGSGSFSKKQFDDIFRLLLEAGVYEPNQLRSILEIVKKTDKDMLFLLTEVVSGKVKDMGTPAYREFLQEFCHARSQTMHQSNGEALSWMLSECRKIVGIVPEANEAITFLEEEHKKEAARIKEEKRRKEEFRREEERKREEAQKQAQEQNQNEYLYGNDLKVKEQRNKKNKKKYIWAIAAGVGAAIIVTFVLLFVGKAPQKPKDVETIFEEEEFLNDFTVATDGCLDLSGRALDDQKLEEVISSYISQKNYPTSEVFSNPEKMKRLGYCTELNLQDNKKITDISPLTELKGLRSLHLDNTGIADISALDELKYLEFLSLTDTQIFEEQIKEMCKNHPGCFVLWSKNDQKRLSVNSVDYVSGEEKLDLSGQNMRDISVMSGFEDIFEDVKMLDLSGNPLGSLNGLPVMKSLEELNLAETGLNDSMLSQLRRVESLRALNLSGNPDISDSIIEEMKVRFPDCKIIYDSLPGENEEELIKIDGNGSSFDKGIEEPNSGVPEKIGES